MSWTGLLFPSVYTRYSSILENPTLTDKGGVPGHPFLAPIPKDRLDEKLVLQHHTLTLDDSVLFVMAQGDRTSTYASSSSLLPP